MLNDSVQRIDEYTYRIPKTYKKGMLVDGIIYTGETLFAGIEKDRSPEQVANVSFLPGIVGYSLAMPDIHWGYGFPIGGVAATDPENTGVISPGGVGFDINCGVRLMRTEMTVRDIQKMIPYLANTLYSRVPSGVGSKGTIHLSVREEKKLLLEGARWAVTKGYGVAQDIEYCEESGALREANPDSVSERAYKRGQQQAGTLGSGNHFLEVGAVDEIFDPPAAEQLGLFKGQVTVMVHSGSRGLGYQVCDDYTRLMLRNLSKYGIELPDRQLACAPITSAEAQGYVGAMRAAANYAWCNRQILMHLARECFQYVFGKSWQSLGMDLVYDLAHNIAKFETHAVNGAPRELCVHRKGATRSLGPGRKELPGRYRALGQPVIIPGDMGSSSYLLLGTHHAEETTFASTCHGAGRVKSRHEASRTVRFDTLIKRLKEKSIEVRSAAKRTLLEESPESYKNIDEVIKVVTGTGLSRKVCRMRPLCVIKG